jgi:putative NIF3 family GTP cyclohydrolase 1 type 2
LNFNMRTKETNLSRRHFGLIAGGLAGGILTPLSGAGITAQEVADRIRKSAGADWKEPGIDGLRAGDSAIAVTGVATTALATVEVMKQATKAGLNLIVTFEPVYFGRTDMAAPPANPAAQGVVPAQAAGRAGTAGGRAGGSGGRGQAGLAPDDPLYLAKKAFIEKNGIVVLRFHDAWQAQSANEIAAALGDSLGWGAYRDKEDATSYTIPQTTLRDMVAKIQKALTLKGGLRVVGDPQAKVSRVALLPGLWATDTFVKRMPGVDAIVMGEAREWEGVEYAHDCNAAGQKKGLVLLGRVVSEDPGMKACAGWIQSMVPEVPVKWIPASDPYWRPA